MTACLGDEEWQLGYMKVNKGCTVHRDARLFNDKRFAWKDVRTFSLVGHPCVATTPLLFSEDSYADRDVILHCEWINPNGGSVAEVAELAHGCIR